MSNENLPGDPSPQSFVVRFWQEAPGMWRGTVRHVQSKAQRGVSNMEQASAFMLEQRDAAVGRAAPQRPAPLARPRRGYLGPRWAPLAGVAVALLALSLAVILLTPATGGETLPGASIPTSLPAGIAPFIVGALVGGAVVWRLRGRGRR